MGIKIIHTDNVRRITRKRVVLESVAGFIELVFGKGNNNIPADVERDQVIESVGFSAIIDYFQVDSLTALLEYFDRMIRGAAIEWIAENTIVVEIPKPLFQS